MEFIKKILQYFSLSENPLEESEDVNPYELYYNNKYPTTPIYYSGRTLPNTQKAVKVDVRDFFTLNDGIVQSIAKTLNRGDGKDDKTALACLQWVIENVGYVSDITKYKKGEFWCFSFETLTADSDGKYMGDCDDGAILLANLMILAGIPNWRVRINAGRVLNPYTKTVTGHAYVTYFTDEHTWVVLDWCFFQNLNEMKDRKNYKMNELYKSVWFSFNDTKSWSKDVGDIRKMEEFNDV